MLPLITCKDFLANHDTSNYSPIPNLLPEGLTLLAAPAKAGSTTLALNLALACARGESALSHFPALQSAVLFLCLETPKAILQSHLRTILGDDPMPENLIFSEPYQTHLADLRRGELSEIQLSFSGIHGIRLIIIDSLEALFSTKSGSCRPDTAVLAPLRALALKYKATILFTSHLKREAGRKPFAELSTSGLLKAVDTALVLNRPHEENLATLHISSNWLPDHSFCLSMNEQLQWHYAPDAITPTPTHKLTSSNNQKVLAALKSANAICTSKQIASATDIPNNSVRTCFANLYKEGVILQEKRGRYYHPDADLGTTQQHNAMPIVLLEEGIDPHDCEFIATAISDGYSPESIEDLLRTRHHNESYIYPPAQRQRDSQVAQQDHATQQHNATTHNGRQSPNHPFQGQPGSLAALVEHRATDESQRPTTTQQQRPCLMGVEPSNQAHPCPPSQRHNTTTTSREETGSQSEPERHLVSADVSCLQRQQHNNTTRQRRACLGHGPSSVCTRQGHLFACDTITTMKHLFLIGLSGSGKSTVGRILARKLDRPLLDIDALIEAETGESIPSLFARGGESEFRACETRALVNAVQANPGAIIATGGGIITRPENRALMAEHGIRIFLHSDPATSVQRLQQQHTTAVARGEAPEMRPLLAGSDPLAKLQHQYEARRGWYEEAELTCSTNGKFAERVVQEILAMLISSGELESSAPLVRHVQVGQDGYDAVVDWGGLGRLAHYLTQLQLPSRLFLITDSNLEKLYAPTILQQLSEAGFEPHLYIVPAGEASKSQQQLNAIYDWLVDQHAERREAIIALGGGVIGDLVGYAAATYLRGVPLIHLPTSLLAQVDSAIGGKTGINHPRGKNLIGAFYHPRLVLADPATLLTLPTRERIEGWAEIVKYGIILDAELFALLEEYADVLRDFSSSPVELLSQIVARCIDLKVSVIEEDEREQGRRAILNYGHTIGHALENVAGYGELLHGEAVSIGMVVAAVLAQEAGMFAEIDVQRQNNLLAALGLPIVYHGSVDVHAILAKIQLDKKVVGKRVRWVMPTSIGEVKVTPLPDDLVTSIVTAFFANNSPSV